MKTYLIIALLISPLLLSAQRVGSIKGRVTSKKTGGYLPRVNIIIGKLNKGTVSNAKQL